MGAASIAFARASEPGPGESGTLEASGVSTRAWDGPAVTEATGVLGWDSEGSGDGVGVGVGVGVAWGANVGVGVAMGAGVAVGRNVGRAVGRGVALVVGRTVGLGLAEALTTIFPNICSGWIWQK